MLNLNLNICGKQFVITDKNKDMSLNTALPNSKGVVMCAKSVVTRKHADRIYCLLEAPAIFFKIGKTGKFRLANKTVYFPLFEETKELIKAGISIHTGAKLIDAPLNEFSDNAYLAWVAGSIGRYKLNYHRFRALANCPNVEAVRKSPIASKVFATLAIVHLLDVIQGHGNNIIDKSVSSCFAEIAQHREHYTRLMHDLLSTNAIFECTALFHLLDGCCAALRKLYQTNVADEETDVDKKILKTHEYIAEMTKILSQRCTCDTRNIGGH